MWGLAIFRGVLRKPMLARGIYCCHWSSSSLCPAQRHKWLTCPTISLTHKLHLSMPGVLGQRLLLYGKAAAKENIQRRAKPKEEKISSNRGMKPVFDEMSKEKVAKSNMKSRVFKMPKGRKIKAKGGETPRQKNINSNIGLKVEKAPKENVFKSKITPQASKEKTETIRVKSKVEEALKEKSEKKIIKYKGKHALKGKIIMSKFKPKIEEASMEKNTHSMMKPRIEKTFKEKNMESKVEVKSKVKGTPKETITDRKMKPKVEENPKEKMLRSKINSKVVQYPLKKSTKSKVKPTVLDISEDEITAKKIKFKVEETPLVKIWKGKFKPQVRVIPNKKIAKTNIKSQVEVTPKSKIKAQVEVTPKEKMFKSKTYSKVVQYPLEKNTKSKVKPMVQDISEETPKVKIWKGKFKPQFGVIPNKKIAKSNIKTQVEVTPKSNIKAPVAVIPKENILTTKIKPFVEVPSNRKINKRMKKPKVEITKRNIKPQVELIPNKKIAKSNIKPQVELIPNKKIKPQVEVTSKSKIKAQVEVIPKKEILTTKIKPFVEETSNRKINKRMKKPKDQGTSKEKSTKSKMKFKVQEPPKEYANMNVHQQVTQVLQDYLYYTRELSFADASQISLNAPYFVSKLLSIFPHQKSSRVTSAVQRHLIHNPINEFEPFFESIGIEPCEIHGLLPHHSLHLNENQTLLATMSTLANIGFPRHKLGKLYVEQPHLFSSSTGQLQKKLQFYENIGVSKASLVSVLTLCPTILDDDVYKQFVKVANGLNGFQLEKNRICCMTEENREIQSSIVEKLMLLVGIGCSWDEISKLYHTKSEIFINSSEQAFYSTIEMFSSLGLRKEDIGSFVLQCPEILQSIDLDKKGTLERILHDFPDLHGCQPNKFLEGTVQTVSEKEFPIRNGEHHKSTKLEGGADGPEKNHIELLEGEDLNHRKNALVVGCSFKGNQPAFPQEIKINENLVKPISRHKLIFLLKVGLAESAEQIAKVDSKLSVQGDKLQERVNYLLGLGFPFHVFCQMVRARPDILQQTLPRIQEKVNFLCSSLPNPIEELGLFPAYLCFHLERRIIPRCKMYDWLKANNMLKRQSCLHTIISIPERRFLKRYVKFHPQGEKYFMQFKREHL